MMKVTQLMHVRALVNRPDALQGPRTLEDRLIPGLFLFAFVGLLAIQVFHALTH